MNEQNRSNQLSVDDEAADRAEARADIAEAHLPHHSMAAPVALDAAAAAAAGAMVGTIAGPVGMAIGAVIGGLVGAATGVVVETEAAARSAHDEELDRDIGVSGGNIGEARADQPASSGRFHTSSLGVSDRGAESSDGPIQNVDGGEE